MSRERWWCESCEDLSSFLIDLPLTYTIGKYTVSIGEVPTIHCSKCGGRTYTTGTAETLRKIVLKLEETLNE